MPGNKLNMKNANSEEVDKNTKYPVIHVMPEQKQYLEKNQYGGTIRLGAWPCLVQHGSKLCELYEEYGMDKDSAWFLSKKMRQLKTHDSQKRLRINEKA